jgi:hypothetical protein
MLQPDDFCNRLVTSRSLSGRSNWQYDGSHRRNRFARPRKCIAAPVVFPGRLPRMISPQWQTLAALPVWNLLAQFPPGGDESANTLPMLLSLAVALVVIVAIVVMVVIFFSYGKLWLQA